MGGWVTYLGSHLLGGLILKVPDSVLVGGGFHQHAAFGFDANLGEVGGWVGG